MQFQQVVRALCEIIPGYDFVLVAVGQEGEVAHVGTLPPAATKDLLDHLHDNWSPVSVDNILVRLLDGE